MSTHPNVALQLTIKAQGTTRALLRALLAANRAEVPDDVLPPCILRSGQPSLRGDGTPFRQGRSDDQLAIGSSVYNTLVLEDDYDEDMQLGGEEGDLLVYHLVTYGFGERVSWDRLAKLRDELDAWALRIGREHGCEHHIDVTANYW